MSEPLTQEPVLCGCDEERKKFGWISAGCKTHGLHSSSRGWHAGDRERTALTVWEAQVDEQRPAPRR